MAGRHTTRVKLQRVLCTDWVRTPAWGLEAMRAVPLGLMKEPPALYLLAASTDKNF